MFWRTFSRLFVFTILYEDTEVEARHFGVDEDSTVLTVAAAGCGVAGLLASRPRRIDAVDGNPHHLALTALKVAAARRLGSHEELYALFGRGVHPEPASAIARLADELPPWARRHWARRHGLFIKGLHRQSLANRFFAAGRWAMGTDEAWVRSHILGRAAEDRVEAMDQAHRRMMSRPFAALAARSPLPLLAHGINYEQRDRNLKSHDTQDMAEVARGLMLRIAHTDVARNWIFWNVTVGDFDHSNPECRPPFLREAHHARSLGAPTETHYHLGNFHDVLRAAPAGSWSHYNFSDALDWMPEPVQRAVLLEVARTCRPGAVLINRTVELECPIARLGLHQHFERLDAASDDATASECSALYRRTDLYRVQR